VYKTTPTGTHGLEKAKKLPELPQLTGAIREESEGERKEGDHGRLGSVDPGPLHRSPALPTFAGRNSACCIFAYRRIPDSVIYSSTSCLTLLINTNLAANMI